MTNRKGKRAYQMPAGSIPAEVSSLISSDISVSLDHFKRTGDAVHLWRAWLGMRALKTFDQSLFDRIAPMVDELARTQCEGLRADQTESRNWVLLDYYHELSRMAESRPGAPKNLKAARVTVANRHKTTQGAVEQMVLNHEGKDGRTKR